MADLDPNLVVAMNEIAAEKVTCILMVNEAAGLRGYDAIEYMLDVRAIALNITDRKQHLIDTYGASAVLAAERASEGYIQARVSDVAKLR